MNRIQTGDTDRIRARAIGQDGRTPVEKATDWKLLAWRRNASDVLEYLDWNDHTFKSSGWTTKETDLVEVDDTEEATKGMYEVKLDTSQITNLLGNDLVHYETYQVSAGTIYNHRQDGAVWIGGYADDELVRVVFAYDRSTDDLSVWAWLEKNGSPVVSGVSNFALDAYDADDNVLFSVTDSTPDGQGVFRATENGPGISAGTATWYKAQITGPSGTVITAKATGAIS